MVRDELDIVIVEDVPADADAIEAELRDESIPFQSRRVETRSEFLAALQASTPDIVLSDFTLPEFDALEALRLLKSINDDVPFILVTGARSEEVAVECIRAGADDYILKASLKRLGASIRNAIQKKAAERERKLTEQALRRSEEQFRLMAENSGDLISLLDYQARVVYASPSFRPTLGHAPEDLVNREYATFVHDEDRAAFGKAMDKSRSDRQGQVMDFRALHADGYWRILESSVNWIFDDADRPHRAVLVSRDVTQRKETESALRRLPQVIRDAQEAERRRVARDLHDGVIQILSSVRFRFQSMEEKLAGQDESIQLDAARVSGLLEKAIREVRSISHNLLPSELYDLGLDAAVRQLVDEFKERTGWTVALAFDFTGSGWSDAVKLNLYRIIQEALTNIEKHARAGGVELALQEKTSGIELTIRDDGAGMAAVSEVSSEGAPTRGGGMGLVDIRERVLAMGGTLSMETARGRGLKLVLTIPLPCP